MHYATRFVDPALGTALGWNYWYSWAITIPTEMSVCQSPIDADADRRSHSSAAVLVLDWWPGAEKVPAAAWITILMIGILATNFFSVRVYGELEFWFSLMKVRIPVPCHRRFLTSRFRFLPCACHSESDFSFWLTADSVGLIILGIFITAGCSPSGETIGFRYWHEGLFQQMNGIPGAKGQFLAFWTVFLQAAYSFLGLLAFFTSIASNLTTGGRNGDRCSHCS